MKLVGESKNFTYGEIWPAKVLSPNPGESRKRELKNPEKYTTNVMFIKYLERFGYRLYLDYQTSEAAYTNVTAREIVINGNYSDREISNMLQHELGHLVLFDVNQFLSVSPDTLRSSIAKVLYTPAHLKAHGIQLLLKVENIIQDIIIETLAEGECVCHGSYVLRGGRLGVKHMERLEDPALIAKEVCESLLKEDSGLPMSGSGEGYSQELDELIDSMLKGLAEDDEEIKKAIEKAKSSRMDKHAYKRFREEQTISSKMDKLQKALDRATDPARQEHLENLLEQLGKKLDEVRSQERKLKDKQADAAAKQREIDKLQGKLDHNAELRELLEAEQKAGREQLSQEKDSGISKNYTDHLADDDGEPGNSHSYDCGFPNPLKATRDELHMNQQFGMKSLSPEAKRKRIKISADDGDNMLSKRIKSQENEHTYFKSSKKEFGMEDMLKGRRRLRLAGVNVLIGLDISGSMSHEWTVLFRELSELVEELQKTVDIENIVYFTYNQRLQKYSMDFDDLTLRASGGNAFGYVYPELMEKLPLMQKNEIILVTDCGDNLGFKLKDSCIVERAGAEVENHISIIDTEGAAFYNRSTIDKDDWSLYRYGDKDLFDNIKLNIENLIDR